MMTGLDIPTRRKRHEMILSMIEAGKCVEQIARETGLLNSLVREDIGAMGIKVATRKPTPPPGIPELAKVKRASEYPASATKVATEPKVIIAGAPKDKANQKAARRAVKRRERVLKDRRRMKISAVPTGKPSMAPEGQHRSSFPDMVMKWTPECGETIFKDGANNAKIGGDVLVGRLKGAAIVTLTLEERTTCPQTCALYRECYGNRMQYARRWTHDQNLEDGIKAEIGMLCGKGHDVLVRLHVLGDFPTLGYINMWAGLLAYYPNLHVFGFTAHKKGTQLGDALAEIRDVCGKRFSMRHSDTMGEYGSFTIDFPTEKKSIAGACVCPEQVSMLPPPKGKKAPKPTHCGTCALCWDASNCIVFLEH